MSAGDRLCVESRSIIDLGGCRKAWLLPLGHPTSKPDCNGGKLKSTLHSLSSVTTTCIQVEANRPSAQLQCSNKEAVEAKERPNMLTELGRASTQKPRMIKGHYDDFEGDRSESHSTLTNMPRPAFVAAFPSAGFLTHATMQAEHGVAEHGVPRIKIF